MNSPETPCTHNRRIAEPESALAACRQRIDAIDRQLLDLFQERMRTAAEIASCKITSGKPVFDAEREQSRIDTITAAADAEFAPAACELWHVLMDLSKAHQITIIDNAAAHCCTAAAANGKSSDSPAYGLLGRTLGHSYSPMIHEKLGTAPYSLFEVEPDQVAAFIRSGSWNGCNVTIPYKETALQLCDELGDAARKIGCVNTLIRRHDGTIFGDNTDYYGFAYLLDSNGFDIAGRKACVLGDGGAAKTVRAVLSDRGAREIVTVSRKGPVTYDMLAEHADTDVLINTTPVGMYPDCPASPVDLRVFSTDGSSSLSCVIDLIYNPSKTGLLLQAESMGISCANGLSMLVAQAKRASELFGNTEIPDESIDGIIRSIDAATRNIVLIGMPGSGKTTIGRLIAQRTGRRFVDIDREVEAASGRPIPQIFETEGETAFRDLESEAISEAGKLSGAVIACGGGAVTQSRNRDPLRQNSAIVRISRPLDHLDISGRPVTAKYGIEEIARQREPLYASWAEIEITNDASPEDAAAKIVAALGLDRI